MIYLQSPSKTVQSTKFSREVFYKKCFLLLSTYQGVCAIGLSWHQADLEKRRLGEDATDGFAYLRGVGRRRREKRGLEPDSGMQRKDKSSWP